MKVVFRADASVQIGSGHVMRCLALAEALRQKGTEVLFVCRELPGNLNTMIEDKDFGLCCLPAPVGRQTVGLEWSRHAAWLGVHRRQDDEETLACQQKIKTPIACLVVDHYALDRQWEALMRPKVDKIMVIDDLADRKHDCDFLLDQNLYDDMDRRYLELVQPACRLLVGPRYALLRPEFYSARKQLRTRHGVVERLLVFYGGSDPCNETAKAIEAIRHARLKNVKVDVVVGSTNSHKEHIEKLCENSLGVHFHCQVNDMAVLMAAADMMLCAGGTTTWERCSLGLPGLVIATATNQEDVAADSARKGLSFYLGPALTVSAERLAEALNVLTASPQCLRMYSANELATVDGIGVQRVVGTIMPPRIVLRRAVWDDCNSVYKWRYAEETLRYIFNTESISLAAHRDWFQATLENPDMILLIGEIEGKPVGVVRYDISETEALISVYLVPGIQGQGIGTKLIQVGSDWLNQNCPAIKTINAEILPVNVGSLKAFEKAGYQEHRRIYQKVL